jgi:hypothetical protein
MSLPRCVAAALAAVAALAVLDCRARPTAPQPPATQAAPEATPEPAKIYLFFPGDDTFLHREVREVPELSAATTTRIRTVLEELLAGPAANFAPAFAWPATLDAVFVDGKGNAYVDFSAPPTNSVEGTDGELMLAYAVINTVVANCTGVDRVQLLFGGHEVKTLGHLDLSRPLPARPQLVAP